MKARSVDIIAICDSCVSAIGAARRIVSQSSSAKDGAGAAGGAWSVPIAVVMRAAIAALVTSCTSRTYVPVRRRAARERSSAQQFAIIGSNIFAFVTARSRGAFRARALPGQWPSEMRGRREGWVLDHTHGPPAKEVAGGSHHRSAAHPAFPAQWLERLIRTLPGAPCSLATVASGSPAGLTSASGGQDHTISPYAVAHSSTRRSRVASLVRAVSRRIHRIPALYGP